MLDFQTYPLTEIWASYVKLYPYECTRTALINKWTLVSSSNKSLPEPMLKFHDTIKTHKMLMGKKETIPKILLSWHSKTLWDFERSCGLVWRMSCLISETISKMLHSHTIKAYLCVQHCTSWLSKTIKCYDICKPERTKFVSHISIHQSIQIWVDGYEGLVLEGLNFSLSETGISIQKHGWWR